MLLLVVGPSVRPKHMWGQYPALPLCHGLSDHGMCFPLVFLLYEFPIVVVMT